MKSVFFIIAIALFTACSSAPPKTAIKSIQVVADVNANQNMATALDIVFAYDTTSLGMLPKNGLDWFDKKAALVSGLATGIDVVSLQIPPAMTVAVPLPKKYKKAIGVYSYANYVDAAGQPAGNLTPFSKPMILLTPKSITYSGN